MSERKLAAIRRIDALEPIEGADSIECATVGGWKVVAQKGLYSVGDLALYFEIDSWIPHKIAPFLSKGKEPREFEGVKGERLKTIKLRGQLSQGLLIPLPEIDKFFEVPPHWSVDEDVTEILGIKKWEKPIPGNLAGQVKGNFPTLIPKTDQERVQNLVKYLPKYYDELFEITEKLDGSSMTCYVLDGVFGVCSRNLDLMRDENNAFWKVAIRDGIEEKMLSRGYDFAVQGELCGPGVQGNIYKLKDLEFFVYDIYDVECGQYMAPENRRYLTESLGLKHVPILDDFFLLSEADTVEYLLALAEGKSRLNPDVEREGIVFKNNFSEFSFKAISNTYLLGEK